MIVHLFEFQDECIKILLIGSKPVKNYTNVHVRSCPVKANCLFRMPNEIRCDLPKPIESNFLVGKAPIQTQPREHDIFYFRRFSVYNLCMFLFLFLFFFYKCGL